MKKIFLLVFISISIFAQDEGYFKIARLKYAGGGDWYNDPSAEVNLLKFVQENLKIKVKAEYIFVDANSNDIFQYPFLFITGHGNIVFSDNEVKRLRTYLEKGGFIYIDDDYGLDKAVRREFNKIFPEKNFYELPLNHPIYNIVYKFPFGVPKTHEHDDKTPKGYAISINNKVVVYYTFESNPSDGWADPEVHKDPEARRIEALKFGANIIIYSLTN
ncbi:MAG TPA: DUF4159 domain-containing protein [Melioribacteraceae bacterium]|nr:DUF4159 domain-containing protein [Melioribacteraceae bacterium]